MLICHVIVIITMCLFHLHRFSRLDMLVRVSMHPAMYRVRSTVDDSLETLQVKVV